MATRARTALRRLRRGTASGVARHPLLPARSVAVASIPLLALWLGRPVDPLVVVALAAWVVVSSWPRAARASAVVDAVLAAGIVFATGDVVSPFLLYVATAVAGAGIAHGGLTGTTAGGAVSLARVAALLSDGTIGRQSDDVLISSLALFPLVGLAAGLTVEVLERRRRGRNVLEDANQLLVELHRVAGVIPGGLDVATVAGAALEEIRTIERPTYAVVFAGDGDLHRPVAPIEARSGSAAIPATRVDAFVGTDAHRLCTAAAAREHLGDVASGPAHWLLVPLRSRGMTVGLFAVGFAELGAARRARRELVELAADTALALDNARLLGATTARAADAARRRIAHDLHDSVAQSLAHLKMELELLTLTAAGDSELRDETTRLARVAGRALDDVRATITGLRSDVMEEGLVTALRRHVEDLRSHDGPTLTFETVGDADVDPHLASDVLRVAQEAISNAVRHARARNVTVSLEVDPDTIALVVEDDGRGMPASATRRADAGVGLSAMQDRAAAVGGEVTLRPRLGGGTVVSLRCPTRSSRRRRRTSAGRRGKR